METARVTINFPTDGKATDPELSEADRKSVVVVDCPHPACQSWVARAFMGNSIRLCKLLSKGAAIGGNPNLIRLLHHWTYSQVQLAGLIITTQGLTMAIEMPPIELHFGSSGQARAFMNNCIPAGNAHLVGEQTFNALQLGRSARASEIRASGYELVLSDSTIHLTFPPFTEGGVRCKH